MPRRLSRALRPAFGLFLFLSQFTAGRTTLFTESVPLLLLGIVLVIAANRLWISASLQLRKATELHEIAMRGPICNHPASHLREHLPALAGSGMCLLRLAVVWGTARVCATVVSGVQG